MKTKYYLLAVSAFALMQPTLSMAESMKSNNEVRAEAATTGDVKTDVKKAWKDIKHDAKEVSKEVKGWFLADDESVPAKEVSFMRTSSASGIIGSPVFNHKDVRVGTVRDIIVNAKGDADLVVIADGEFPGFDGKLVAFPFADITKQGNDGDVIAPLSETGIDVAAEFEYSPNTGKAKVKFVPEGGYSVAKILGGDVLSSTNEKVGSVEDVYFKGGDANMLIIGFDKTLGMGGKNVVAEYAPTKLVRDGTDLDIQLSAKQSAALANYKKVVSK